MRREPVGGPVIAALLVWSGVAFSQTTTCLAVPPSAEAPPELSSPSRVASLAKLPLAFEENRGQADKRVDFLSRGGGYTLLLSPTEATFALRPGRGLDSAATADVTLRFEDSSPTARASGVDPLPGHVNYYLGNDPAHWRTGVPTYARVRYEDVYPGIDLVYYGNPEQLEYDLVVAPGASPERIRLTIEGAERIELTDAGDLVAHTDAGDLIHRAPRVYQEADGKLRSVEARYQWLDSDSIAIRLGDYDADRPLVIDPTVVYSTFLGGTVSGSEIGTAIAADAAGDVYVLGNVSNATGFPGAPGPSGASEIFVSKINAAGSAVLFTTFIGGSGADGSLLADLIVDQAGSAYFTGGTFSTDFPTLNAFQTSLAGSGDAVVVKLDASGSIVYSTYLGGSGSDFGGDIAVDSMGHAYVTGTTASFAFPTTANAFQLTKLGFFSAYLIKLSPDGSSLIFSTYLGGRGDTLGTGIAIDDSGNIYVSGRTIPADFPTTPGAFQPANAGGFDAFITKFDPTGTSLVFSTFLGGSSNEDVFPVRIAVDATAHVYVSGPTVSTDFPTTPGALQSSNAGGMDGFVAKLTPSGSALVFSTYLGGSLRDVPFNLAVDAVGNVHLAGDTQSADFPTFDPVQAVLGGQQDVFVATINSDGTSLLFSTFWGGRLSEDALGITLDGAGNVYATGRTSAHNTFPTTPGALQLTTAPVGEDAFILKLGDVVQLGPTADAGVDQSVQEGTQNVTLDGTASTGQGLSFDWQQIAGLPVVSLPVPGAATPNFDAPFVGADTTLTFELTVTDAQLQTSTDTVDVTILNINDPPVANAGPDLNILASQQSTTLLAGSVSDPDAADTLTYRWLEGATELLASTPVGALGEAPLDLSTLPAFSIGPHVLTLEVSDGLETAADTMTLTVTANSVQLQDVADIYVRNGAHNTNEGGSTFLRIRQSGKNRALVRFDQGAIQAAIGSATLASAVLELEIVDNGNNWGNDGRPVSAHQVTLSWIEGNGFVASASPRDRGSGSGATWNCAVDADISNSGKDCADFTEWEMGKPNQPELHPWVQLPTATQIIQKFQAGTVSFDVTADVVAFLAGTPNYGWIIKKDNEGQSGRVNFGSKESLTPPRLVLTLQ